MRLHRPGPILAFGRQDTLAPRFAEAAEAARAHGFEPVIRVAGGRAAVFHEGTLSFSQALPDPNPAARTRARFAAAAEALMRALRTLGIDARVGEVPGEYCRGAFSVNARGKRKLVGIGQRYVAGGAHVGGVVVLSGGERIREVLIPVYEALDLDWDPGTVGAIEDEVGELDPEAVESAILAELAPGQEIVERELDPETLSLAARLEVEHRADTIRAR